MLVKSEANFIYVANFKKDNGSPSTKEIIKTIKVDIVDTFSDNYYKERGRTMRTAMNIVCNSYNTNDLTGEGLTYLLKYVEMKGVRYTVEGILNYNHNIHKKLIDMKKTL